MKFEAPRGTHDILPSEQPRWRRAIGEAERLCALYGYRRIDTPAFEDTELFARTSGQGSDVVQKEMYTFEDRGGRSLTLRPEATAPIARAYLQHGLHREPQPQKLYTVGPMWRYSAPQRGRYREHWQVSVEAIGSDDPAVDAEIVQLYDTWLRNLGVEDYTLQLNSIGDRQCRPAYLELLEAWLDEHDGVLDDEAREKRRTSPLRVFDVKSPAVLEALAAAPKIGESLVRGLRAALRDRPRPARRVRRALRAGSDPRPRPRLLHAHDLGVRRPRRGRAVLDLRRRPVRLPRRGDRRPADAGRRVRRRDRAAAARHARGR